MDSAESRRIFAASIPEAAFQGAIENALTISGHLWAHFRPARTQAGWRTAMSGHPGFPDLIAISRDGHLKVAEVKTVRGIVRPEQHRWLDAFSQAGALADILRPGDDEAFRKWMSA